MPKLILELEENFDFTLIGIFCHSKDYRLAFELNKKLKFELVKEDDYVLKIKGEICHFGFFSFIDEESALEYYLVSNKGSTGKLIGEEKNTDYFLAVKGEIETTYEKELLDTINKIQLILKAYSIEVSELKSKRNLIF